MQEFSINVFAYMSGMGDGKHLFLRGRVYRPRFDVIEIAPLPNLVYPKRGQNWDGFSERND